MIAEEIVHTFPSSIQETSQAGFSRLLIVEDDLAQLRTLTKILEAEGFIVVGCQRASEGLQQVRRAFFSVIIIDLNLPDLPGVALAEQIRALSQQTRIIVHTGYGSFTAAKTLLNLGVFAFVEKLSDPQELVSYVHRANHAQISQYAQTLEQAVAERSDRLRETEIWLELAQAAAGVGTLDWDLTTRRLRCSLTCWQLYGRTPTTDKLNLHEWVQFVHPEDRARVLDAIDRLADDSAVFRIEYRIVWPDGRVRWISDCGQVIYDANRPVRFLGATIDITERIEAQQALHRTYSELEQRVQERTAELQQANQCLVAEIEERRKTEQALRLANFSLDHAADAILFAGPDAQIFYVNEALCKLHDYTRAELLTMRVHDLNPPLGQWLLEHYAGVEEPTLPSKQEYQNQTRTGRMFPVEFTINYLKFHGIPYHCLTIRDITERRAAEAQRRQQTLAILSLWKADIFQEGHFYETIRTITRVAAETLGVGRVGVWLFSEDRLKLQCITVYELATAQHSSGAEFLAAEYPAYFQALEKDRIIVVHNTQTDPLTATFVTSYLMPLNILAMLDAPIRIDEGLVGVLCHEQLGTPREWSVEERSFANALADLLAVVIQTNKRLRVEQKLHESEELRELAVQGAGIGVWDWDVPSGAMQVDERGAAMCGYALDEIAPHVDCWLGLVHPEDQRELKRKLDLHFTGEAPYYEAEYRTQTKSGQWKWIFSRGRIVKWDELGRPLRFLGTQIDISNYKQLEQQLLHAQKMEAIGRLAGGVAHDFNNMLTVISSYSELILHRNDVDERTRLRIEEIKKASARAALLTQQLLTFSRKQVTAPIVLDLNLVLTEMDQMLRRLIGEDVDLQLALAPEICWIKADPVQMEQVIMNLVINARDAMPAGGSISIGSRKVYGTTQLQRLQHTPDASEYVVLSVADKGTGMDEEIKAHIFEPFFTTKAAGKGTGLGLSMVFGIVQQHNGYIEVDSEIGRGTAFHIYLPVAEADAHHRPSTPLLPNFSPAGEETILLVEDEEQIRVLACIALQEAGYTVLVAANGQDALTVALQHGGPLHLLLTDVIMPGMNGAQLNEQIDTLYPTIKTLYISGYADSKLAFPLLESTSRAAYLPKPFTPTVLTQKVREVLDAQ